MNKEINNWWKNLDINTQEYLFMKYFDSYLMNVSLGEKTIIYHHELEQKLNFKRSEKFHYPLFYNLTQPRSNNAASKG